MKLMKNFYLLALATVLGSGVAYADETQKPTPEAPAMESNNPSLTSGQDGKSPIPGNEEQEQKSPPINNVNQPQNAQELFEESLRQMMPLDQGQIQEYRERSVQRERSLLPVSPDLKTRTVRVALEPGRPPIPVYTTANVATSIVFHDSTGQPWPVTSVTNGSPNNFQILRPELPEGNLLNIMPKQSFATSTIVVTLESKDVPLIIKLESDSVRAPERNADALVLFQLAHYGPRASVPILRDIKETTDSFMLAFLDRVPPKEAARMRIEPASDDIMVWKLNDRLYVRTSRSLMWPAWNAVVNGAGNVKCYETIVTSRLMLSNQGQFQTVLLKSAKMDQDYEQ